MNWQIPKADYWVRKLSVYLHDPITKPLHIPGHEERSKALLTTLGALSFPAKEAYQAADRLAAGMDRSQLPGHKKKGSIDFIESPCLTHPTGEETPLTLRLPESFNGMDGKKIQQVEEEVLLFLNSKKSIGHQPDEGSLSDQFKGDPEGFAFARFLYVHLQLRNELAKHNVAGLGELWGRLPADTRQPDHSIWQHNGLVSALSSCCELSEFNQPSLLVYSLTPVQEFISKARKLRDYWTGSVLLSWLAFSGIRAILETLGPDHILYPNLLDQPLVNEYCRHRVATEKAADHFFQVNPAINASVASFPNKFVCLVPRGREPEYAAAIEASIRTCWMGLAEAVKELVKSQTHSLQAEQGYGYIDTVFERQNSNFWEHQWAATPLLSRDEEGLITELLGNGKDVQEQLEFLKNSIRFAEDEYGEINKNTGIKMQDGRSALYGLSHKLVQSALASIKNNRTDQRSPEPGIKCDLYSEFEIVTCFPGENPKPKADRFWNVLRKNWRSDADFTDGERLCSISLIKRLAYAAVESVSDKHRQKLSSDSSFGDSDPDINMMLRLLGKCLKDASFPSTTEIAASDYLDVAFERSPLNQFRGNKLRTERRAFAQFIHNNRRLDNDNFTVHGSILDEKTFKEVERRLNFYDIMQELREEGRPWRDSDSYYAILLMDGDKMGELVNGVSIAAQWGTILHPKLYQRMNQSDFDKHFRDYWSNDLQWEKSRRLSPALHATISEALGDFALYGVSSIIEKHRGKLIYAGGDDVCAVLPVSSVLQAAEEIARVYAAGFVRYQYDQDAQRINVEQVDTRKALEPLPVNNQQPEKRIVKLAQHLGKGEKLTISAGINICHHKQPLTGALKRTHTLLDSIAKEQGGRNAVAIELNKRSGGGRLFLSKWSGENSTLDAFKAVGMALGNSTSRELSSSIAYRLKTFEEGLLSIIECTSEESQRVRLLQNFVLEQIKRSELTAVNPQQLAIDVVKLIKVQGSQKLQIDGLIVSKFLGERSQTRCIQEKP